MAAANEDTDKQIEIWKVKRVGGVAADDGCCCKGMRLVVPCSPACCLRVQLIKALESARGNGTSMISLILPPKDQVRLAGATTAACCRCRCVAAGDTLCLPCCIMLDESQLPISMCLHAADCPAQAATVAAAVVAATDAHKHHCMMHDPPPVHTNPQISRVQKMLGDEYGTASNIKSRVNRLSVLGAITSAQQRLKLYNKVCCMCAWHVCGGVVHMCCGSAAAVVSRAGSRVGSSAHRTPAAHGPQCQQLLCASSSAWRSVVEAAAAVKNQEGEQWAHCVHVTAACNC